ncbi:DUF6873 family GME fold protein [Romboutsia sp. 1001713B170207_170306_H8]|uniref:DUF6873 family GME fold protein n=1 Tax=Romboutsia sp. 1001713B170207_170306_H8 TaxID=2787112 RepID=UPI000820F50E|nr:hypothetical protein [Romboutsia sp. 1001713B170207_170306_H8]SCH66852.1 Uncharacterised protein [uncultured Clostridium sp.]
MKFVKKSFILEDNLLLGIVDKRITMNMENKLKEMNINIIKTPSCEETYNAIKHHPDITVCKLNDNNIVVAPNVYDFYNKELKKYGFNVIKGNSIISNKYPNNIQYNVAILGNIAIHNFNYTDSKILQYLDDNNFIKINVNQGYCKCSICIVDDNSIITSDEGIYNSVRKYNIDCLLIEKGHIQLFDLNYGFIGGCSGLISKDIIAFFGNIKNHPDYDKILEFVSSKSKNILSLSNEDLLDLGSLIPLCVINT